MKLTIATTFLALVATTAVAADAVQDVPAAPVAAAPAFTWSGPYLGLDGGASWLNGDFSIGGASDSQNFNGGVFGGFAGYNFQFDNNFVVGVEGNLEYNWNEEEALGADVGTDWAGAVRGRVGYAFDRALLYGAAVGPPRVDTWTCRDSTKKRRPSTVTPSGPVSTLPSPTTSSPVASIGIMTSARKIFSVLMSTSTSTNSSSELA